MKTNRSKATVMMLSFLALCLGVVSCYDDTALLERIEALETTKIATINQQIDAIKGSITDLEATDKELDAAIAAIIKEDAERDDRIKSLNDSIANLQETDAATLAEIEVIGQTLLSLIEQDKALTDEITSLQDAIAELQATDAATQAQIDAIKETLQNLFEQDEALKAQIAEIENAIAELRAVDTALQAEIEAIKETLQALAERDERFQADVDSLKAKDIALDIRINELKAYTDSISSATKDWASATFSTLEQYQATCDELAAIKVLIAEQEASIKQALTDAIATSESSIKGWVNEQLTGYWTIAETQAKLDTIKTNTDKEVAAIKADLKAAKEELTAAYKSEIAKAITDSEGKLSAKIDEINSALDKRIGAIEARLDAIEEKLNNLTREFAIKFDDTEINITDGGTATVSYTITGATDKTIVKALGQNGWTAKVTPKSNDKGTITVTAPNPLTRDEIIVLVYDGEYRTIMSTLNFVKGFATPSQTVVEFGAEADTVSIELTSNIDCTVSIPIEAQSWLSVVEFATRATKTETINFACTACAGGIRKATVTFVDEYNAPISTMSFIQQGSALEVTLTEAGTLLDAIGRDTYQEIKGLIINGPINGTDIICLRRMKNLTYLNMENARIVAGGEPYYTHTDYNGRITKYFTENDIIGDYMFYEAPCFQEGSCEVILPQDVTTIGYSAFFNCQFLTNISLPSELSTIGDRAFYNCYGLTRICLPSELSTIGYSAFYNCCGLTRINLPSELRVIGDYAFQSCNLEEVILPKMMSFIGNSAFAYNKIKSLTIPNKVRRIGREAFISNPITEVYLEASPTRLRTIGVDLFNENVYNNAVLYIPKETMNSYFPTDFGRFQNIIESIDIDEMNENSFFINRSDTILPGQVSGNTQLNKAYSVLEGAYEKNYLAGVDAYGNHYQARNNVITYDSELYSFDNPLQGVLFIVHEAGGDFEVDKNGNAHFALGRFEMFDTNGHEIELTEDNLSSNATEESDGIGILGLIDDNPSTYFHSLWKSGIYDLHYLEVTLPEGKYNAFSFSMAALSNSHSRVFPAVLEIQPIFSIPEE